MVAGWLHLTQAQISRIEGGPPVTDLERLSVWARILGIPSRLLWFALPDEQGAAVTVEQAPPRRSLPALPTAVRQADVLPLAPLAVTTNTNTDVATLEAFRVADRQVGGGHLYATVTRYLQSSLAPRLFGSRAVADGSSVFTAASGFTEMAGWMAHDAGHDDVAERHFQRSLDLADNGGDRQLRAHIYASLSHLLLHLGRPEAAVSLAQQGQTVLVDTMVAPSLTARLLAMEARGLAVQAESTACAKVLLSAEQVLERSPAEAPSPWVSPFDAGSLASEAARCMQHLGQLSEAEKQARRIMELRADGHTRSRAFGQLLLIAVLIAKGHADEACDLAREVLDNTEGLGSQQVSHQLEDLQAMLEPYHGSETVVEFLPCLEEAVRQRSSRYGWIGQDGSTV
ncbi:hypothetical protein AGRA3207_000846 [Actinomadura graeca]|uniref:Uncharacterized protein n=1 Tax=Actinomadura graeca TaxID=2750812 RepID=A0ABX8QQZ7_9ACTN|nr:hypothetical protein [Actinomadura graeca]QXJ20182.1 hypothetical protein AGRA3207_000846 [Actinomadura graeca]